MLRRILSLGVVLLAAITVARAQDAPRATATAAIETKSSAPAATAAPDARAIMQRAVAKDIISWQAAKDYTFLQRAQVDELDGNGKVKSSTVETHEILMLYGEPFESMVAKDDNPLSEKEQKKQDEKFEKETNKRANETPEERQKRLDKFEKERQENRAFVRELLDAYDFTLAGSESVNGRET